MQKIKKYVENFFRKNSGNARYQMRSDEMESCRNAMIYNPFDTINTLFCYGYAKGYRAALAETKKGGAVA